MHAVINIEKQTLKLSSKFVLREKKKEKKKKKIYADPDVIRTRSLLIWSQTRYHCATESTSLILGKLEVQIPYLT